MSFTAAPKYAIIHGVNPNLKTTLKTWPVVFLAGAFLCALTAWVAGRLGISLHEQMSLDYLKSARGWKLAGFLAYALLAAPAGEEIVFRFLLFKLPLRLVQRFARGERTRGAGLFAAVSSLLFVAVHYNRLNPFPDNAFVALFFFGLAQCWLYRKTSRLWAPVLNHILFNVTNVVFFFALPQ